MYCIANAPAGAFAARDKRETPWIVTHCQGNVQGTVESEGCGDGRYDLSDQPVQVGVSGPLNIEVTSADIVDGLVVDHHHEGMTVRVLQGRVGGEDGVVGFSIRAASRWVGRGPRWAGLMWAAGRASSLPDNNNNITFSQPSLFAECNQEIEISKKRDCNM